MNRAIPKAAHALVCALIIALPSGGAAFGQGRGGQAPPPAPVIPSGPDRPPSIEITGRIIAPSAAQPPANVPVRIETTAGTEVAFTFADALGNFRFREVVLAPTDSHFIVVEVPGFEIYRERLDYQVGQRRGSFLSLLLRPESTPVPAEAGPRTVDLSQLLAEVPEEARREYDRALEDVGAGRHEAAAERLERVVEMAPDYFAAHDTLGAAYLSMGRYLDAEAALSRAMELDPAAARPWLNLGTLFYQVGELNVQEERFPEAAEAFVQAIGLLEEAIRREPLAPLAHHHLGAALHRMGDYPGAEASLREALRLNPAFGDARLVLINVYTRQARYDEALLELDAYLEGDPPSDQQPALARLRSQIEAARGQ